MVKASGTGTKKEIMSRSMPQIAPEYLKPTVYPSPLSIVKKHHDFTFSAIVRYSCVNVGYGGLSVIKDGSYGKAVFGAYLAYSL